MRLTYHKRWALDSFPSHIADVALKSALAVSGVINLP